MVVETLEEEVVSPGKIPVGQLPPWVPLREPVEAAVWLTSAMLKEGRPYGERCSRAALAGPPQH